MTKESTIGGLPTPVFYPSVSSVSKNVWSVIDHVELLVAYDHPQFLVSCFDIYKEQKNKRLLTALNRAKEQNQIILWDSGIYEMVWSNSKRWNKKRYIKTLNRNEFIHAFAFDDYCLSPQDQTHEDITNSTFSTIHQVGKPAISPIIHCKNPANYPLLCKNVSNTSNPKLIAIPERELGKGILEVTSNIKKIRKELNNLSNYQPLHILGTGNPLSIMLYTFAGADSFDGLDWCQTIVDYESGTLHHPMQLDFYKHQSQWGNNKDVGFLSRCYLHNLEFYKSWMPLIQEALNNHATEKMLNRYLPTPFFDQVSLILLNNAI